MLRSMLRRLEKREESVRKRVSASNGRLNAVGMIGDEARANQSPAVGGPILEACLPQGLLTAAGMKGTYLGLIRGLIRDEEIMRASEHQSIYTSTSALLPQVSNHLRSERF